MFLVVTSSTSAAAMDAFEIQVYDGKINDIGEVTLETHLNHVVSAKEFPDFEGQIDYAHLTHITFEFARGMTPWWELGAYLQTAVTSDPNAYWAGEKLRSKFVLPDVEHRHFHLGINTEIAKIPARFEDSTWGMELRPIIGYTWDYVTVLFNPILDIALSAESQIPTFEPAIKVVFDTHLGFGIGPEYYMDLGPINHFNAYEAQEHYIFGAFDLIDKPVELNVGVGHGFTNVSNGWVAKMIVGFSLYKP
jgi:hypothetical protein